MNKLDTGSSPTLGMVAICLTDPLSASKNKRGNKSFIYSQ